MGDRDHIIFWLHTVKSLLSPSVNDKYMNMYSEVELTLWRFHCSQGSIKVLFEVVYETRVEGSEALTRLKEAVKEGVLGEVLEVHVDLASVKMKSGSSRAGNNSSQSILILYWSCDVQRITVQYTDKNIDWNSLPVLRRGLYRPRMFSDSCSCSPVWNTLQCCNMIKVGHKAWCYYICLVVMRMPTAHSNLTCMSLLRSFSRWLLARTLCARHVQKAG